MKKLAIVALLAGFLEVPGILYAQQRWTKTYGTTYNDVGRSVQQTLDGGYIVVGWGTSSHPHLWLIKTDASGDTVWTKTCGGLGNDMGYSVQQTSDSGYIVVGYTDSYGSGLGDVWLVKTDISGDTLWTKTIRINGGTGYDCGYSVQQTADGGYVIAGVRDWHGYNTGNICLIKTNAYGDTLWTKTYAGGSGKSVQQTADGGYIVAGCLGQTHPYLIKTNSSGDTLWTKSYGNGIGFYGSSAQQTADGGYIVVAACPDPYGSGYDVAYLIKTNSSGDTLWSNTYGGRFYPPDTGNSFGYSVRQTADGGYVVAGITNYKGTGTGDVYLVKTNGRGDTLWTKTYGGTNEDWGYSVQQTADGGYIVAGETASFGAGQYDIYLIKTDGNGVAGTEMSPKPPSMKVRAGIRILPNPFASFARIPGREFERFSIYDVSGRKAGTYRGSAIGGNLLPGIYFVRSDDGNGPAERIVKLR